MAQSPYPFFETLLLTQGVAQHAQWHMQRICQTLEAYRIEAAGIIREIEARLKNAFDTDLPTARLRIEYGQEGYITQIAAMPEGAYSTLQPITAQHIDYQFKYTNRLSLENAHAQRGEADDVLLVIQGNVTDTTIANLMLLRQGEWFTPSDSLLAGTKQSRYIAEQGLIPIEIPLRQLDRYERIIAINALRDAEIERIG